MRVNQHSVNTENFVQLKSLLAADWNPVRNAVYAGKQFNPFWSISDPVIDFCLPRGVGEIQSTSLSNGRIFVCVLIKSNRQVADTVHDIPRPSFLFGLVIVLHSLICTTKNFNLVYYWTCPKNEMFREPYSIWQNYLRNGFSVKVIWEISFVRNRLWPIWTKWQTSDTVCPCPIKIPCERRNAVNGKKTIDYCLTSGKFNQLFFALYVGHLLPVKTDFKLKIFNWLLPKVSEYWSIRLYSVRKTILLVLV